MPTSRSNSAAESRWDAALARLDAWFTAKGWSPFDFQRRVWSEFRAGRGGLIHATTGTGKTFAAWFGPILQYLAERDHVAPLPTESGLDRRASKKAHRAAIRLQAEPLRVLWITPLRALAADTETALRGPITELGLPWTVERRTGDTAQSVRSLQRLRLPTALVTTPESLCLMLTHADARERLASLRLVVVDEWHELLGTKRGVQAELALARLRGWNPQLPVWGLSATLGNLDEARDVLLGTSDPSRGGLVRGELSREYRIETVIPETMERFPWAGHIGLKLMPRVADVIEQGRSTLVFTNTRWQTEAWYQALLKLRPDWAGLIALHHGSLDPEVRTWVEVGLREGRLKCVVCTSSLDLGVDFAPVDQVVQIGSPKGIARLLQRAGRSGHQPGVPSRLVCVPTNALELIEFSAARDAIGRGAIEGRTPLNSPLDVLAQHAVTLALGGGFIREEFAEEVRSARTYAGITDSDLDWVLDFVTRGGPALRAYPEYRRVALVGERYVVTDPDIARRHRMSLGTIVSDTQMIVQYLSGGRLGTVEESFLARLKPGDTFVFAGRALQLVRIRDMRAYVRKAPRADGPIPRWEGGRMPLSSELAAALRRRLEQAAAGRFEGPEMERVRGTLEIQARWSRLPAADELLIERTKTREGHHIFAYPLEGRLVHEGLAALCAYRLSRWAPISFSIAVNDFGFELLSAEPAPLEQALAQGLFAADHLGRDVLASLNSVEMARRQFREIARVAGLVFQGFPGAGKSVKQLQATSGLVFDVFENHDPRNRLLEQARSEVLERQLEQSRLADSLDRIAGSRLLIVETERPTPLAFPLLVDRLREKLTSEKLGDRVRKMQVALEKVADQPEPGRTKRSRRGSEA